MNHRRGGIVMAVLAGAGLLLGHTAGCTQAYPQKNLYVLAVAPQAGAGGPGGRGVLRVQPVRMAKPFDERTFVYRTGASAYTVDYYNGFLADPERLLTGELTAWLSQSGLFEAVVSRSSVDSEVTLETNVTAMYGDYSVKGQPKAVLEARFVLLKERPEAYKVVFQKVYRQSEPMGSAEPERLIQGWETALRRMLEQLSADLETVVGPTSQPSVQR